MVVKHTGLDRLILALNAIFLTCAVLVVVVPLVYIVVASFMDPTVLLNRGYPLMYPTGAWMGIR